MKVSDLVFESSSCCGTFVSASVELSNGETMGIIPRDNGLYNLSFYNDKGLIRRENGVTKEQLEALLQ